MILDGGDQEIAIPSLFLLGRDGYARVGVLGTVPWPCVVLRGPVWSGFNPQRNRTCRYLLCSRGFISSSRWNPLGQMAHHGVPAAQQRSSRDNFTPCQLQLPYVAPVSGAPRGLYAE